MTKDPVASRTPAKVEASFLSLELFGGAEKPAQDKIPKREGGERRSVVAHSVSKQPKDRPLQGPRLASLEFGTPSAQLSSATGATVPLCHHYVSALTGTIHVPCSIPSYQANICYASLARHPFTSFQAARLHCYPSISMRVMTTDAKENPPQ